MKELLYEGFSTLELDAPTTIYDEQLYAHLTPMYLIRKHKRAIRDAQLKIKKQEGEYIPIGD